ncbi:hypothetical protein ACOSQ3_032857 [Xanthoceras sorbifolium]
MVNPLRTRKRVHALRRAPDGSAFKKCGSCGDSVAVALADMHECRVKVKVKRFKGVCEKRPNVAQQSFFGADQLRSPFRLFMESFVKTCERAKMIDIDRKGFEVWKNMSEEEKQLYYIRAETLNATHQKALMEEVNNIAVVDDEADSAMVGKVDECYDSAEFFCHSRFLSSSTSDRKIAQAWWTFGESS